MKVCAFMSKFGRKNDGGNVWDSNGRLTSEKEIVNWMEVVNYAHLSTVRQDAQAAVCNRTHG